MWACWWHFINKDFVFPRVREHSRPEHCSLQFPKDRLGNKECVYIFSLEHGTYAISIFIPPFWLFHLGGCKNFPAWNSHCPGIPQAACRTVILLKCCVITWSSFLCCLVSFLSFHYFHFFSFMWMFFISNSLSCVLLSLFWKQAASALFNVLISVVRGNNRTVHFRPL